MSEPKPRTIKVEAVSKLPSYGIDRIGLVRSLWQGHDEYQMREPELWAGRFLNSTSLATTGLRRSLAAQIQTTHNFTTGACMPSPPPKKIRAKCPNCSRVVTGRDRHVKTQVKCPGCGESFEFRPAAVEVRTKQPPKDGSGDLAERWNDFPITLKAATAFWAIYGGGSLLIFLFIIYRFFLIFTGNAPAPSTAGSQSDILVLLAMLAAVISMISTGPIGVMFLKRAIFVFRDGRESVIREGARHSLIWGSVAVVGVLMVLGIGGATRAIEGGKALMLAFLIPSVFHIPVGLIATHSAGTDGSDRA